MVDIEKWLRRLDTYLIRTSTLSVQRMVSAVETRSGYTPIAQARAVLLGGTLLAVLGWGMDSGATMTNHALISLSLIVVISIGYTFVLEQRCTGRRIANPERLYFSALITRSGMLLFLLGGVWLLARWYEYVFLVSMVSFWYVLACDRSTAVLGLKNSD